MFESSKKVKEAFMKYELQSETNPDLDLRYDAYPDLIVVLKKAGDFLGTSEKNLSFLSNVADGLSSTMKSLGGNSRIVFPSFLPGPTKKTLEAMETLGLCQAIELHCPLEKEQPTNKEGSGNDGSGSSIHGKAKPNYAKALKLFFSKESSDFSGLKPKTQGNSRLTVVYLPASIHFVSAKCNLQEVIRVSRDSNAFVFLDASLTIGRLPMSLDSLSPDFFVAETHCGFGSPVESCLFYLDPKWQKSIKPTVISWNYLKEDWRDEFLFSGTRSFAPFRIIKDLIQTHEINKETLEQLENLKKDLRRKKIVFWDEIPGVLSVFLGKDHEKVKAIFGASVTFECVELGGSFLMIRSGEWNSKSEEIKKTQAKL